MKKIYTVYSEKDDLTFIMEETDRTIEVKGFYFGEPNEDYTSEFYGCLIADISGPNYGE